MTDQLLNTPARHAFSLVGFLDDAWHHARERAFQTVGASLARIAEAAVVSNISKGQLCIDAPLRSYAFPEASNGDGPQARIRVRSDTFWIRLATMVDLGFSESYMYGEIDCEDLIAVFRVFLLNNNALQRLDSRVSYLFSLPQKITSIRFLNTLSNSRSNISAHYDISNKMFAGFLSEDMTYSCAIFKNLDGDIQCPFTIDILSTKCRFRNGLPSPTGTSTPNDGTLTDSETDVEGRCCWDSHRHRDDGDGDDDDGDNLHAAQLRKLDHVIRAARIAPGQRVLEIGSGWGSLAVRIATHFSETRIDTLTLSVHQQDLVRKRAAQAGKEVEERVNVHLLDYRNMPAEWKGAFDRVVSIEMVEAVGKEFLQEYWRIIDWALKPDIGIGVVQGITIPEGRFERYSQSIDFIQKWVIFPGGMLPSLTLLLQTMNTGSQGRLVVDSVSNIGPHYARTLREWKKRFLDRFENVIVPALREEYPEVMGGENGRKEVEVFKRKWLYYYCYCEVGFTTHSLGDHIITFSRDGNESLGCSVYE